MNTVFGFFPPEALSLENQVGQPTSEEQHALLTVPGNVDISTLKLNPASRAEHLTRSDFEDNLFKRAYANENLSLSGNLTWNVFKSGRLRLGGRYNTGEFETLTFGSRFTGSAGDLRSTFAPDMLRIGERDRYQVYGTWTQYLSNNTFYQLQVDFSDDDGQTYDPRFGTADSRRDNAPELTQIIADWTKTRSKEDVMAAFAGAGVPCGAVFDTSEVLSNAHLRERGMVIELEHPTRGSYPMIGCPVRLSDSPVEVSRAPLYGEHSDEVFTTLGGLTAEAVEGLRREGVVA